MTLIDVLFLKKLDNKQDINHLQIKDGYIYIKNIYHKHNKVKNRNKTILVMIIKVNLKNNKKHQQHQQISYQMMNWVTILKMEIEFHIECSLFQAINYQFAYSNESLTISKLLLDSFLAFAIN